MENKQKKTTNKNSKSINKKTTNNKSKSVNKKVANDKSKIIKKVDEKKDKDLKVKKEVKSYKKTIAIIALIVVLFAVLFGISESNNKSFSKPENFSESEQEDLNAINVDDYLVLKAGSDISVIYIARPTCSHCANQTPRMKYIKYKYDVEINYLNTDDFDAEGVDYQKLVSSDSFFDEGFGTPTILIVQNDRILDSIAGESSVSNVVELLKKYDLIKK